MTARFVDLVWGKSGWESAFMMVLLFLWVKEMMDG
jgi:hypothetical protein